MAAAEGFMLYLLTGSACLVLGSSLPHLIRYFDTSLVAVAAMGSAFALGRVLTVFFSGTLTEKWGAKPVVFAGLVLLLCFFTGVPLTRSVRAAQLFSVLGGIGMGTQDAACPVIFTRLFPRHYPSFLSAGQAFFGAGCFLPSLVLGFILRRELPFHLVYRAFAVLSFCALLLLPLAKMEGGAAPGKEGRKRAGGMLSPGRWFLFAAICVFYCATTNTVDLYTTSYAAFRGIDPGRAVYVLTGYSAGSMAGSLAFSLALRKVRALTLLRANLGMTLLCLGGLFFAGSFAALWPAFFVTGLFLGAVFGILVILAVELLPENPGRAGALTAMIAGGADIAAPLATGLIVNTVGPAAQPWILRVTAGLAILAALRYKGRPQVLKLPGCG
jgi:fucose permease